jgi:hypothetical protein
VTHPELKISPEPTAEERTAIEAAVALVLDGGPNEAAPGTWWQTGIHEAIEEADDF